MPSSSSSSSPPDLAASSRQLILRITLDEELFDSLSAQAIMLGAEVEPFIVDRLAQTLHYQSENPIYLDDAAMGKIRKMLGGSVSTAAKLVDKIRGLMGARFESSSRLLPEVHVTHAQIAQIGSYARTLGKPFDEAFEMIVREAIAQRLQA